MKNTRIPAMNALNKIKAPVAPKVPDVARPLMTPNKKGQLDALSKRYTLASKK